MLKAVVIDIDDTLCLTEAICFEMENDVLVRMGREPMGKDIHIRTWGRPLFEIIDTRSPGVDIEEFSKIYHTVIPEYTESGRLDTIPDANLEALDKIIKSGKKVMLLTSRTHGELKHMLEPDHYLASRVEAFYYRDNMQFHKPDPRAFDELLKEHSLKPDECVYIGDSLGDADASNKAGIPFICSLEGGLKLEEDFRDKDVIAFVQTFPEILSVISGL